MMRKRLLSWFLAMVMVLGLLPMTVWAEETQNATENMTGNVEMPFTAKSGSKILEVVKSDKKYSYSDWSGEGEVDLYEVTVPEETEEIQLTFTEDRLAYGYNDTGSYVASYGEYGEGKTGQSTALISGTFPYCVWVQTPYDDFWNTEFLYAIKLNYEGVETDDTKTDPSTLDIDKLLENIAKSYADRGDDFWITLGMAAYEDMVSAGYQMSDIAKQKYINQTIENLAKVDVTDTELAKAIISLTSIGIDAEKLFVAENAEESLNAVAGLMENRGGYSTSAWDAPFILAAYNQNTYKGIEADENTDSYEANLIEKVLEEQKEDGSWVGFKGTDWEESVQATSNMIAGLAFYYDDKNADVKAAVDKAVEYLSEVQKDDGSFDAYGYGADANTMAMVVIGLSAVGIDADTDGRFIKNGNSALDALLGFALENGFWYSSNTEVNDYATKQAFLALIAASCVEDTYGQAFNIYDFSHNTELKAGYFEKTEEVPSVDIIEEEKIVVSVSIDANGDDWLDEKCVSVAKGATVYDAFMEALKGSGIKQKGASGGYIESMTKDGVTLGEFTEGENSGWLYKVNGELSKVGIKDCYLDNGDDILFYYTEDWKKDPDAGSRFEEIPEEEEAAGNVSDLIDKIGEVTLESADAIKAAREAYDALTDEEKELVENYDLLLAAEVLLAELLAAQEQVVLPAIEEIFTDMSADIYCYEAVQWAVANGIVSGVTETEFGPEQECSRGQLMTLIWRLMGKPEPKTQTVPYIDVDKEMYYHDAILWAVENKLANGTDPISFSPEMTLTRGQTVTFLWRAAGMPEPAGTHTFADVTDTDYYVKAVQWAAENGITSGTGDNMFSPEAPCTRGQIVTFLYRCFGK